MDTIRDFDDVAHPATVRVRLGIAYDGSAFHGWARQPGLPTVQGLLEEALAAVVRHPVELTVAGRTDAGVHARGQCAHADIQHSAYVELPGRSDRLPARALHSRLDGYLCRGSGPARSSAVVVTDITEVGKDFDARFSATGRHYCYRIADAVSGFDPLSRQQCWWVRAVLDVDAMQAAASYLLGEWDFAALCRPRVGATTIRELRQAEVRRNGAGGIEIGLHADAFCHSMVRSIVGCLVDVGRGHRPPQWLEQVLASRDRSLAGAVAPAHGLTLEHVDYPPPEQWQVQQQRTRRLRGEPLG